MGSKQLDVEGGVGVVRIFPVENVHLHLIVVACGEQRNKKRELQA